MQKTMCPTYTRPQDKHGLLAHWRQQKIPALLDQLERILLEHGATNILDRTAETTLYTSGLRTRDWQVTPAQVSRSCQQFDAVICMDDEFTQYLNQADLASALRSMFDLTCRDGIVVFCAPDFEPLLESHEDREITPLMLGDAFDRKYSSIIRYMYFDGDQEHTHVDYTYNIQDWNTCAVTVDWDTAACEMLCIEAAYDAVQVADGCNHSNYLVGHDRLFVCSRLCPPYVGPTSIARKG